MADASLDSADQPAPSRGSILLAYALVYVIWGSTYLGIRFAIETLPPFLMAAARFLVAGGLLYAFTRARGAARPSAVQWRAAAIVGGFLLFGGNGAVVWAEQRVPSGVAALLVAILPLWIVLLEWVGPEHRRPSLRTAAGVLIGIVGVTVLVGPGALHGNGNTDLLGATALVLGSLSWAIGSLYARRAPLPKTPQLGTAMQMLAGGAMLAVGGLATGEASHGFALSSVSLPSAMALLYLIVFGSLVGFSAYVWLLRVEPPSRVATYAYVNPVVAVALGWLLAGERMTPATMLAAAIIVAAVALIVSGKAPARPHVGAPPSAAPPPTADVGVASEQRSGVA